MLTARFHKLPRRMVLAMCLSTTACTPTGGGKGNATATAEAVDTELLLYGDAVLKKKMQDAISAKGADYVPRTKHKSTDGKPKHTNRLIFETSPYLGQHAHNPVNWFPWGDEAFRIAKKLGRPIFLSVGYSTCHWCHVMEEESFEDEEIAKYMNDHYVCIKVDREERPDVDSIYMRSVQILTGRGGWPMSVWLTHERKPFYGGTYFPARTGDRGSRKGFLTLMQEQQEAFRKNPSIADDAERLAQRIKSDMAPPPSSGLPGAATVFRASQLAGRRYDPVNGGPKGAPKFPSSFPIRMLMRYGQRAKDETSTNMALYSLRKMQAGGMYDHVAGGFHRYSTDARWLVPHFEKMLYDNALLANAYLEGAQVSGDADLARVAREILDYVAREMTSTEGGYYSATDADSIGPKGHREEGYYFTWTPAELDALLPAEQAKLVKSYYAVTDAGNFEHRNILFTPKSRDDVAKALKLDRQSFDQSLEEARATLLKERNKRPKPIRDDKIQVSWNGLMISAMARGARVLGNKRYRDNATRAAKHLVAKLVVNGRLHHSYKSGQTTTTAFAEDYAFLSAGLIDLFEATSEVRWLAQAVEMMNQLEKHHGNKAQGGYFRTADDAEKLLAREVETRDGAVPSAGSLALMNQLRLWSLTTDDLWRKRAETTMRAYAAVLEQRPHALDEMMLAVDFYADSPKEIVLVTPDGMSPDDEALRPLLEVTRTSFVPNHVFVVTSRQNAGKKLSKLVPWAKDKPPKDDKPTAYVCERGACDLPTTDPAVFRKQINDHQPYPGPVGGR
jgi:uncharacterized protein YyaL (SSP411 family)